MSTSLNHAVRIGAVVRIAVDIGPRRMPMRELFGTVGFVTWAGSLPNQMLVGSRLVSPAAEMNEILARFVAGARVGTDLRGIMPSKHGVFRLLTTSFALLGWAERPQCLILSHGASKDETHERGALTRMKNEAVAERKALGLSWDGRHFNELFCFQG
jgi:hypothetical protein